MSEAPHLCLLNTVEKTARKGRLSRKLGDVIRPGVCFGVICLCRWDEFRSAVQASRRSKRTGSFRP